MNALQQFLTKNSVDNLTEEVTLGGRLKDFKFKIKALTGNQYNDFQALCIENPNSPKKRRFNIKKFNELIVANCVVEPNFKDPEWLKELGVADATSAIYKTLLAGEITDLAERVLRLSGFDRDIEEEMEEVKN
ncbi:MAG TPA: hypothetical protein PKI14_00965 [Fervidobacterium sp.]|nr:hypothetical protein [Fervidobacterium sp.]